MGFLITFYDEKMESMLLGMKYLRLVLARIGASSDWSSYCYYYYYNLVKF